MLKVDSGLFGRHCKANKLPRLIRHASRTVCGHMRHVHAKRHSCFMPATLRMRFCLDKPPDGRPAFEVTYEELHVDVDPVNDMKLKCKSCGLEWKVRLCLLVAIGRS